jgi:hypothetical protein
LYQRGIYPQETFQQKKNYGLAMMVTKDDGLLAYLTNVTKQMTGRGGADGRAGTGGGSAEGIGVVQRVPSPDVQQLKHTECTCRVAANQHPRAPALVTRRRHGPLLRRTDWLEKGLLQRLVLVVTSAFTGEVLERWTFEVQTDEATLNGG